MDYSEVKSYLLNMPRFIPAKVVSGETAYNLDAIKELLKRLKNPEKKLKFVHVAGTNGKGSTVAFLDNILCKAKIKSGTFRTPHLVEYTEIITLGGKEISEDEFSKYMTIAIEEGEKMGEEGLQTPSEFELLLAASLLYFKEEKADLVILEAGLGGRRDATNVIPSPIITIFTPIGIDHVEILGNTLEEIAREKAGIIKKGTLVVCGNQPASVEVVLREYAIEKSVHFIDAPMPGRLFFDKETMTQSFRIMRNSILEDALRLNDVEARQKRRNLMYQKQLFAKANGMYENLPEDDQEKVLMRWERLEKLAKDMSTSSYMISLLGPFQAENATTAVISAAALNNFGFDVPFRAITAGLLDARWPARFEVLMDSPVFVCDGAHNIPGVRNLVRSVKEYFPDKKIHYIVGILADKKHKDMLRLLLDTAEDFRTIPVDSPRSMGSKALAGELDEMGAKVYSFETIEDGIKDALDSAGPDDVIISMGSLYNAGAIKKIIKNMH